MATKKRKIDDDSKNEPLVHVHFAIVSGYSDHELCYLRISININGDTHKKGVRVIEELDGGDDELLYPMIMLSCNGGENNLDKDARRPLKEYFGSWKVHQFGKWEEIAGVSNFYDSLRISILNKSTVTMHEWYYS